MNIEEKKEQLHSLKKDVEELESKYLLYCDEISYKKLKKQALLEDINIFKETIKELEEQIEKSKCEILEIKPINNSLFYIEFFDGKKKSGILRSKDLIDFSDLSISPDGKFLYIPNYQQSLFSIDYLKTKIFQ